MSTPALARAKRELGNAWTGEQAETIARDVVSAALHNPDDPEGLWLYGAAINAAAASLDATLVLPESYIVAVRAAVDAVRAEVLGEEA